MSKRPSLSVFRVASVETDERTAQRIAALAAETLAGKDVAVSLVDKGTGHWQAAVYFRGAEAERAAREIVAMAGGPAAAKALRVARIAAKDWVRESLAGLAPVAAGRFIIHGAHDRARISPNRIGIEIEAALAFGTGHHGTTRGCLLALDRMCKAPSAAAPPKRQLAQSGKRRSRQTNQFRILDLGTGSGVLAIAAARALRRRVLATDNDASAVRAARANARRNRVGPLVGFVKAEGVTSRSVRARAPFDLIFGNILLRPLQRFATALTRLAAPGGRVVLSGLLPQQANAARAAYHALVLERRIALDGWVTLVLKRKAKRPTKHVPRPLAGRGLGNS